MRTYQYVWRIHCAGQGCADLGRVQELLNLALQDLIYDDHFVAALDEHEAVTIDLEPAVKVNDNATA